MPLVPMVVCTLLVVVVVVWVRLSGGEQFGCNGDFATVGGGDDAEALGDDSSDDDDCNDSPPVDAELVGDETDAVAVLSDDSLGSLRTTIADVQPNRWLMCMSLRAAAAAAAVDVEATGCAGGAGDVDSLRTGVVDAGDAVVSSTLAGDCRVKKLPG